MNKSVDSIEMFQSPEAHDQIQLKHRDQSAALLKSFTDKKLDLEAKLIGANLEQSSSISQEISKLKDDYELELNGLLELQKKESESLKTNNAQFSFAKSPAVPGCSKTHIVHNKQILRKTTPPDPAASFSRKYLVDFVNMIDMDSVKKDALRNDEMERSYPRNDLTVLLYGRRIGEFMNDHYSMLAEVKRCFKKVNDPSYVELEVCH